MSDPNKYSRCEYPGVQRYDEAQTLLKQLVGAQHSDSCLRSMLWRILLSRTVSNAESFLESLENSRKNYSVIREARLNASYPSMGNDVSVDNPLSQLEHSSWHNYFRNKELQATIRQDVVRTFPEVPFFRDEDVQTTLVNILFCYSLENPQIGYKQGMHELLAPLLFTAHVDRQKLQTNNKSKDTHFCSVIADPAFLEHDAYALFSLLMEGVKCWFSGKEECTCPHISMSPKLFTKTQHFATNELVKKLSELSEQRLKSLDLELYLHLERLEISPQVFGIRWLRLLFGREFPFDDILVLWDSIFSCAEFQGHRDENLTTFPFVDHVFLAMLLTIRNRLLSSDYTGCLQHLMRFPPMIDIQYIVSFASHLQNPVKIPRPDMPSYMVTSIATSLKAEVEVSKKVTNRLSLDSSKLRTLLPNADALRPSVLQNASFKTKRKSLALNVEVGEEPRLLQPSNLPKELRFFDKLQPLVLPSRSDGEHEATRRAQDSKEVASYDRVSLPASSVQLCVELMTDALRRLQGGLQDMNIPLEHDTFLAIAELKQVRDSLRLALGPSPSDSEDQTSNRNGYYLPSLTLRQTSLALDAMALEEAEEVTDRSVFVKEVLNTPFSAGSHI